ncbi:MAG: lectin-like domain-containing protein [Flavobacteriales bacterium]
MLRLIITGVVLLGAMDVFGTPVTFSVDMSQQIVSPNGIHIAGDFQGWDPASTAMIDMGNGIYSITIDLPPGTYYFKFINGNAWGTDELVPTTCGIDDGSFNFNREIVVGTNPILLPAICFGECSTCTTGTYTTNGSAVYLGGQCHEITQNTIWQSGAIWSDSEIDLNINFTLQFVLNFGNADIGADGMAFVLQRSGNGALGNNGGGLGYMGISPSLEVEFDTFENPENGDPVYDHVAIQKMGDVVHSGPNNLAPAVQMSSMSANVEDGSDHIVELKWNATTHILEVYFDCVFRQQIQYDMVNQIFGGESLVYWGITGSTGSDTNIQTACIQQNALVAEEMSICPGSFVMLHAGASIDGIYTWTPNLYLDNASLANPTALPPDSIAYSVTVTDLCNQTVTRNVTIHVLEDNPACAILPVRILSFHGERNNGQIQFTVLAETDALHESFVIQKSRDGFEFADYLEDFSIDCQYAPFAATMSGDDDNESIYFRLMEKDIHGRRQVSSNIIHIALDEWSGVFRYSQELRAIQFNNSSPQVSVLSIFSIEGKLLSEKTIAPNSGMNIFYFPEMAVGVHLAVVNCSNGESLVLRFVVR